MRVNPRERYFANGVPPAHAGFVDAEMHSLIARGCVVKWKDVRDRAGLEMPRLIQALSIEETKPRILHAARPLKQLCRQIRHNMDTVARVVNVPSEDCNQGPLDDSSDFHNILLHPASWPLFGLAYRGVDYVWYILPFGCCESPNVYRTFFSEAKVAYLQSKGIPALANLYDSYMGKVQVTHGLSARQKWLAAAEADHVAMPVPFRCGYFLAVSYTHLTLPTKA